LVFNPLKIDQPAALRARGKIGAALARWAAPKHHGAVPVLGRIAIACVKNEQDIIEPFLRHHAPLMDLIFVLDNNSSDDTHRIIAQLVQELGNVVLVDKPPAYHGQAIFVSQAMRYVQSACFADQIFFWTRTSFWQCKHAPNWMPKPPARSNAPCGQSAQLTWGAWRGAPFWSIPPAMKHSSQTRFCGCDGGAQPKCCAPRPQRFLPVLAAGLMPVLFANMAITNFAAV
jgi:hypothetical protein